MKKMFNRINEAGTMLVEAMAMLGLIAMVTPILYKKAAERTTELQDINASNQLRILANAMDAYIKDNFTRINDGETVVNSCDVGKMDYSGFTDATSVSFDISHLCEYLPYGFLKDGKTQDSKLFSSANPSFQVVLRKTTGTETDENNQPVVVAETVTGFLTAVPNEGEDFPSTRVSRIATMVGSNGGYVEDDGEIMGAQGIWSLPNTSELGLNLPANTFVISSLQPISSQGLANEDVLHRKTERQNDYVLNSMETDLFMSYSSKNHNIRQVNQIIMRPQKDWMVGGDLNTFKRDAPNENEPTMEYGQTYKADLDYTLYIGDKGGAYMEGNLAALSSLFTVRSELENDKGDGGIKYYGTNTTTNTTDPNNPVTTTNKDKAIFSVTTSKMEYGNIDEKTAGALLTVDKDNGSMEFESKTGGNDPSTGAPIVSGKQKLIAANAERVNVIDGALSVRNPGIAPDGGKYDNYHKDQWPEQNAAPAVIVGGGNVHKASYTTYTYNEDGTPAITGDGAFESSDLTGEHALTVNGPAFVKDSLKTAKLKAYNVDAAKLRAGVRPEDFDDVTEDKDFYLVAEQKGTDAANPEGRMLVGHHDDPVSGELGYRMQIAEADDTLDDGTEVQSGIRMKHESGINVLANATAANSVNIGLVEHDVDNNSSLVNNNTADGQIKLGAFKAISLSTIDENGVPIDKSVVSIQDDMLRAYARADKATGTNTHAAYVDSVTDYARFISQEFDAAGYTHDDLYQRERTDKEANLFGLGGMDFTISETKKDGNKVRPVVDIRASREDKYLTSRFSGGFAIYDHDVSSADYPDNPLTGGKDGSPQVIQMGNPALYINKGDFRILTTVANAETQLDVKKGDTILQVDNNSDENVIPDDSERGSVYIRKGAINLASASVSAENRLTNAEIKGTDTEAGYKKTYAPVGYIAADRFIAQTVPDGTILQGTTNGTINSGDISTIKGTDGEEVIPFNKFEVNPAYTSVMHDIKLTTRGGARLSDILPDFVNKGIYVVDNTFADNTKWADGQKPSENNDLSGSNTSAETYTSAYLGFIPSPTCPPGYSKVITINPSGWAMAQAGTPMSKNSKIDISTHNNPYLYWYTQDGKLRTDTEEIEPVNPLTFQKSTWLKAMVLPECGGLKTDGKCSDLKKFTGWGTVMGFIYPAAYYQDFLSGKLGATNVADKKGGHADDTNLQDDTVYWNLYPVHYRELEAYVTVYCYFRREAFDSDYVDTAYDQLKAYKANQTNGARKFWSKTGATNLERLNDPALEYNDPW